MRKWLSRQEYRDTRDRVHGEPNGMVIGPNHSRPDSETSFSRNRNYEIPFETKVFKRYSRSEKALVNAIIESYLQGVLTRNVEKVVSYLGVNQISLSYVSKVAS
jgi:transposase-like protein